MASAADEETQRRKTKTEKLIVAAIDFGTTYSGYAYSFRHEYNADPMKISAHTNWVAGSGGLMSLKTPTVLLLKPDKTFMAFGYEAEDAYKELAEDDEHRDYYYFRRFKMLLHKVEHLKRSTTLPTQDGSKELPALLVFSMSIKYLKDQLMNTLNNRHTGINDDDVLWVLTVPAIWCDGSKQFMREAAEMAGIKTENLRIALEPEAASLFCMHLPVDKMTMEEKSQTESQISPFSKGTKYMVVDVGGGTVDITVHQVVDENRLKELFWASGGSWGGTRVDKAFEKFLAQIFGDGVWKRFCEEATEDVIDLHREFETKKRSIKIDKSGKETVKLPAKLFQIYTEMTKKDLGAELKANPSFTGKVACVSGKLRIDTEVMKSWFDKSCKKTVSHVKDLLKHRTANDINTILLVGGFSESPMMQAALKSSFPDKRIIVPEEAGLVVLKGAVLFGHNPITIESRMAKVSYGIRVYRDFQSGVHPEDKKVKVGKRVKCADVFACHVKRGQELVVGQAQSEQRYTPLDADQETLVFDVYSSTEEEPQYVTDVGCSHIGKLEVEVPGKGKDRAVWVKMIFGGTEITVEGREEKEGKVTKTSFNFLE